VIISTALISTFFAALAIDITIHMKSPLGEGMSSGLRLLLDRNPSHSADLLANPFVPTTNTQAIIVISFGIEPVLVFLQHRLFPQPFDYSLRPKRKSLDFNEKYPVNTNDLFRPDVGVGKLQISLPLQNPVAWMVSESRFSLG